MMDVKEYLKRVMTLELSCYQQDIYIKNLNRQLYTAQNPSYYLAEEEDRPVDYFSGVGTGLLSGAIAAVIVAIATFFIIGILEIFIGIFHGAFYTWLTEENGENILLVSLSVITFGAIFLGLSYSGYEEARKNYEANLQAQKHNEECRKANNAIQIQSKQKVELLTQEIAHANDVLTRTLNTLKSYYQTNTIYEKYQSLVPVVMFNEYFASGRVKNLPEAYDRYEQESRLDLILTKLDDIITRLDRIENNQYMLANELRKINSSIDNLCSAVDSQTAKLQQISDNQEITNYYERINAINTSYMAWVTFNIKR